MSMTYINVEKEAEYESVYSSHIYTIGYDPELKILEVWFRTNGSIYQYYDVPKSIWDRFLNVQSKGKFFWNNVRGKYTYAKIT